MLASGSYQGTLCRTKAASEQLCIQCGKGGHKAPECKYNAFCIKYKKDGHQRTNSRDCEELNKNKNIMKVSKEKQLFQYESTSNQFK